MESAENGSGEEEGHWDMENGEQEHQEEEDRKPEEKVNPRELLSLLILTQVLGKEKRREDDEVGRLGLQARGKEACKKKRVVRGGGGLLDRRIKGGRKGRSLGCGVQFMQHQEASKRFWRATRES